MTVLPGVTTRAQSRVQPVAEALDRPTNKRQKRLDTSTTPSPPHKVSPVSSPKAAQATPVPSANMAFEQWLDDVNNVDISLSISVSPQNLEATTVELQEEAASTEPGDSNLQELHESRANVVEFKVSIPTLLTRVLQSKLAIDPTRLTTTVQGVNEGSTDIFVAIAVKGREEQILEAIEGGLTPRKAFLRSAPHISRVASRLQDCMRQVFGMKDFVVKVD